MHTWLALLLLLAPSSSPFAPPATESSKQASVKAPDETPAPEPVQGRVTLVESETVQTGEPFESTILSRMVDVRSSALQACYERVLRAAPAPFEGRIVLSLTISRDGRTWGVQVNSNGTGNEMTASCVVRVLEGFRFNPGPEGDAHFTLTFEFTHS